MVPVTGKLGSRKQDGGCQGLEDEGHQVSVLPVWTFWTACGWPCGQAAQYCTVCLKPASGPESSPMYSNPETREKKDDGNYVRWDTLHSAAVVRSWLCGHASAEHPASTLDMHNFYLSIN